MGYPVWRHYDVNQASVMRIWAMYLMMARYQRGDVIALTQYA